MSTRGHSLLAILLLCASACGGDASGTAPSRTPDGALRLQGRVTDFASGAPLANAPLAFGTDVQALTGGR